MSVTQSGNRRAIAWMALGAVVSAVVLGRAFFGSGSDPDECETWNRYEEQRVELQREYAAKMGPCFAREAIAHIDSECSVPGSLKDWSEIAIDAGMAARDVCADELPEDDTAVFADGCEYWRETRRHWAKVEQLLSAQYGPCYVEVFRERGDRRCAGAGPFPPVKEFLRELAEAGAGQCAH